MQIHCANHQIFLGSNHRKLNAVKQTNQTTQHARSNVAIIRVI